MPLSPQQLNTARSCNTTVEYSRHHSSSSALIAQKYSALEVNALSLSFLQTMAWWSIFLCLKTYCYDYNVIFLLAAYVMLTAQSCRLEILRKSIVIKLGLRLKVSHMILEIIIKLGNNYQVVGSLPFKVNLTFLVADPRIARDCAAIWLSHLTTRRTSIRCQYSARSCSPGRHPTGMFPVGINLFRAAPF